LRPLRKRFRGFKDLLYGRLVSPATSSPPSRVCPRNSSHGPFAGASSQRRLRTRLIPADIPSRDRTRSWSALPPAGFQKTHRLNSRDAIHPEESDCGSVFRVRRTVTEEKSALLGGQFAQHSVFPAALRHMKNDRPISVLVVSQPKKMRSTRGLFHGFSCLARGSAAQRGLVCRGRDARISQTSGKGPGSGGLHSKTAGGGTLPRSRAKRGRGNLKDGPSRHPEGGPRPGLGVFAAA